MLRAWQWRCYRLGERLGWPAWLALVLLLAGLLFAIGWWYPASAELARLEHLPAAAALPPVAVQSQQQRLQRFVARFPPLSERSHQIARLMAIADSQSLLMEEVSYRMDAKTGGLSHYRIDFSTVASYAELHTFLSHVLSSMPLMSLESLTLRRDDRNSDQIEARVQLVLHFAGS